MAHKYLWNRTKDCIPFGYILNQIKSKQNMYCPLSIVNDIRYIGNDYIAQTINSDRYHIKYLIRFIIKMYSKLDAYDHYRSDSILIQRIEIESNRIEFDWY